MVACIYLQYRDISMHLQYHGITYASAISWYHVCICNIMVSRMHLQYHDITYASAIPWYHVCIYNIMISCIHLQYHNITYASAIPWLIIWGIDFSSCLRSGLISTFQELTATMESTKQFYLPDFSRQTRLWWR